MFDPEDIFDLFFNIHRNQQRQRANFRNRENQNKEPQSPTTLLMSFLPILLPLFFSLFLFNSNIQYYSFQKSNDYKTLIKSRRFQVDFYVRNEYHDLNYNEKLKIHNEAEKNYFTNTKQNCQYEYWSNYQKNVSDPYSGHYCREYKRIQNLSY
jgi:hypothetical protein